MANSSTGEQLETFVLPGTRLHVQALHVRIDIGRVLQQPLYDPSFIDSAGSFRIRFNCGIDPDDSYRGRQMRRGIYLGHHLGPPADFTYEREGVAITLAPQDASHYLGIFWHYGLKFALSVCAAMLRAAHIKGVCIANAAGEGVVICGRGGVGKTTLADALCGDGYALVGNTHVVVKAGHAWAVPTWIRDRSRPADDPYRPPAQAARHDFNLKAVLVLSGRRGRLFERVPFSKTRGVLLAWAHATGAYDLKEDLLDWAPQERRWSIMDDDLRAFEDALKNVPIFRVEVDIRDPDSLAWIANRLESILPSRACTSP